MINWRLPSPNRIDTDWKEANKNWLEKYLLKYDALRFEHPLYKTGWFADAQSAHRFIPRLVWWKLMQHKKDCVVLDFGTYDGTLVKALRESGIIAYGFDNHNWKEMWDLLDIAQYMNLSILPEHYSIVVALNTAHNWKPTEFIQYIISMCDYKIPEIIIADRDQVNAHFNNEVWNSKEVSELGFKSFSFPEAQPSRDLLIWGSS